VELIDSLLIGGSTDAAAYVVQGIARLRRGQAEAAEAAFNEALKTKPDDAEALNGLGVALALQNKPEAASKFLAAIKANQYQIDAWLNLAFLCLAAGRPEEAGILLDGAATRDPGNAVAAAGAGFLAVLKGAYAEASSAFERARKVQPEDFYIAYALGRLKLREGRAREALDLFRESLKANPDYLPSTTDAALAYLMLARDEQRQAYMAPADKQAPFRERADQYRGNAQTLLEASFRSDATSYAANMALGCVYAVRGRVREAGQAFERASTSRVGVPDPLNDYGRGYLEYWYGLGNTQERLAAAELRFSAGASHANLQDPSDLEWKAECARASKAVEDWNTQRIFIQEPFDGNALSMQHQWIPVGTGEPMVRFANNAASIGDASGESTLGAFAALEHRDLAKDAFLSVEWTFIYEATQGFVSGFSLYLTPIGANNQGNGLHFFIQEDAVAPSPKPLKLLSGPPTAADRGRGPNMPPSVLGSLPAAPNRLRFKLERTEIDAASWRFTLSIWDDAKSAWRSMTEGKNEIKVARAQVTAPGMIMQFWAKSSGAKRKWAVGLDDVRVLIVEK
jgi:Tfp pilus assembly protein PilF